MSTPSAKMWTSRELLAWMIGAFTKAEIEPVRLCAETLLCHVLDCDRLRLMMDQDRPATEAERAKLRDLVGRALKQEPVQYLVGHWPFYGIELKVDRRALIPRPCTEKLVDLAAEHIKSLPADRGEQIRVADVCTGSGCLAIAIATQCSHATAVATDIDADALSLAQENVQACDVADRVSLVQGDLLDALSAWHGENENKFDVLVSNPPYIPDDEWDAVESRVKDYEPAIALRGGSDGMSCAARLLAGVSRVVRPGGLVAVEITPSIAEQCIALCDQNPSLTDCRIEGDLEGYERFVVCYVTKST